MTYEQALARTDPARIATVVRESPGEKSAIERFTDFFSLLSEENVRTKVRQTYAEDAYFNDTLKELTGVDEIEAYMLKTTQAVHECRVEMSDMAESGGNYYFRWVMSIRFKRLKRGHICRSVGMTHVRFNGEGKVVLHHDFWDSASGLFDHLPLVGGVLRAVKAGF